MHVPYSERHWKSEISEFYYIQPFADIRLPTEFVDLILDNNAFIRATQDVSLYLEAAVIPQITGCGVNPWPALTEQWFSNPQFLSRSKDGNAKITSTLLEDFLRVSAALHVKFPNDYIDRQLTALKSYEKTLKRQIGILFSYVAVIRSIQKRKQSLDVRLGKFEEFTSENIPIFNGLICLAVLTFYAQENRSILIDDDKQLISTIDSFYQPKNKEKSDITPEYLRNRATDLWIWYSMASMYQSKSLNNVLETGTPVIVTADKFLATIPFRFIPPTLQKTTTGTHFEFHFSPDGLPSEHQNRLIDLCNFACKATLANIDTRDQEKKLENMFKQATKILAPEDQAGFEQAWEMWVA